MPEFIINQKKYINQSWYFNIEDKIRDLFKVKLYTIRAENEKREREFEIA